MPSGGHCKGGRAGPRPASAGGTWGVGGWVGAGCRGATARSRVGEGGGGAGWPRAPPAGAGVFSVDEKPQIQALERTAPVLPMLPGVPERRSHDYERHGTVDLFAALNIATGKVIGKTSAQHAAGTFKDFLPPINHTVDPPPASHPLSANLSVPKAPAAKR